MVLRVLTRWQRFDAQADQLVADAVARACTQSFDLEAQQVSLRQQVAQLKRIVLVDAPHPSHG